MLSGLLRNNLRILSKVYDEGTVGGFTSMTSWTWKLDRMALSRPKSSRTPRRANFSVKTRATRLPHGPFSCTNRR